MPSPSARAIVVESGHTSGQTHEIRTLHLSRLRRRVRPISMGGNPGLKRRSAPFACSETARDDALHRSLDRG